ISPLLGFVAMNVAAAGVMELIGIRRPRGRDLATGIVLGSALGLAALFLYLDTTVTSTTGVALNVLFGSIFTFSGSTVPVVMAFSALAVGIVVCLYRPLVLSTLGSELAAARGVAVRVVGVGYLGALALAVSLSAVTIGAILSTALLIGPAAAALRLTKRTGLAMLVASVLGLVATWGGILLAYDSYYWPPHDQGWPVSFFVVSLIFVFYLLAGALPRRGPGKRKEATA
ncbi:MAG: metal ABC transporter permease, partial [Acidimicrobiales bacterium]